MILMWCGMSTTIGECVCVLLMVFTSVIMLLYRFLMLLIVVCVGLSLVVGIAVVECILDEVECGCDVLC
jgi:hypothetical protein